MAVDEETINAAIGSFDETSTTTAETEPSTTANTKTKDEPKNIKAMVKAMNKVGDGTNIMKESIITFSNPDGSDKTGDTSVPVSDMEGALTLLKELADAAKDKFNTKQSKGGSNPWEFRTSPHALFDKTLDDTFHAFLMWARAENKSDETAELQINVSKAFRRLESYVNWMEDTKDDLVSPPLTTTSFLDAKNMWDMKITIDKEKRLVWWFDFGCIDFKKAKKIKPEESLRVFVWYCHFVMYDKNAQENGMVMIENMAKCGFWETMTMMPMKLSTKLDRLSIGVLPVKFKSFIILETPAWCEMMMKFMGMFMSKKMKKRMRMEKDWKCVPEEVGMENIPVGWANKLEGGVEVDIVDAKYFNAEKVS